MKYGLTFLILLIFPCFGQDHLVLDEEGSLMGVSVTDRMSYFEDEGATFSPEVFLEKKSTLKEVKMTSKMENLDFKNSTFFIHFTLENKSGKDRSLVLETGQSFTNHVNLYCIETKETMYSGDAIPFDSKSLPTNRSALRLFVPSGENREYVLQLNGEGEKMNVPMYFFDMKEYLEIDSNRKMFIGIFLGIFIFVSIIYITFFVMLKERLFLIYVLYAFFSGVMQFTVDGYMHEFVFPSGGYFTQHCFIFISGVTVILGMLYTMRYLALTGGLKKVVIAFISVVLLTVILSLIPEIPFEIIYQMIMASSLGGIIFMISAGYTKRKKISRLFLVGLTFLILGATVFILGSVGVFDSPMITDVALKMGTLLEMICLSILMAGRYRSLQAERENAQKELLVELEEKNRIVSEANERLELEVGLRTREIEEQRLELKEQNEDFMSSVNYAKRIQTAALSNVDKFKKLLPNSFVLLKPKDIVSGDFFRIDELTENKIAYATADCTGHGVPGALVSIIGNHALDAVKLSYGLLNPGRALDRVSIGMNAALNSRYASQNLRDGMDLTLCVLDEKERKLYFSGARNSAYIVRNGELIELKGDRKSIGFDPKEETHEFQTQTLQLEIGDVIYTCSDGYADQFGGPQGKKFMSKQLKKLFIEINSLSMEEQYIRLKECLEEWIGDNQQLDDVLIIGVRITD